MSLQQSRRLQTAPQLLIRTDFKLMLCYGDLCTSLFMPFRNLLSLPSPLSLTFLLFFQRMCYMRPLTTRLCVTCGTVLLHVSSCCLWFQTTKTNNLYLQTRTPELHLRVEIQCWAEFCFHSLSPASNLSNKLPLLHGSSIASTSRCIKVLLYHVTKNINILLWQQQIVLDFGAAH